MCIRDRPWEGVCATPALGDAGSYGGILDLGRYQKGKLVAELPRLHRVEEANAVPRP